ncbi:GGDEF domain-containing protein [Qipengyuania sphaerica]|uniref:GGDEF domain-containing protein n=1 Tax=Qipengyuania sphaerica TaxID=2867243 RepID=UPI001C878F64|nr:GGDEF domain-containing protein [Qipengyuania sphaerica]MBX7540393.1 GGDEF domain-containing protein [Qipengyuania sphaerica]
MPVSNVVDEQGFLVVTDRPDHGALVLRETLSGVLQVERRNLPAQLLLWIAMVLAATHLPNGEIFVLPLVARLAATTHTGLAAEILGRRIHAGTDYGWTLPYVGFALLLGGASWGYLLATVMADPVLVPATMVLGGGALVGVSLITAILAPTQRLFGHFLAGFVGCFSLVLWLNSAEMLSASIIAVICMAAVFMAFAYALSSQRLQTSRALVENRLLSEELAESLAHAEFLAFRDPLTGLLNRRAFFEFTRKAEGQRDRHLLSLDLDNFKSINDRHGHVVGDKVLVHVSKAINHIVAGLPEGDHCAVRLGGEEFAVVIDTPDTETARNATESLREQIAGIADRIGIKETGTTCSIGLSSWTKDRTIDDVICRADDALYKAKARGRNRVENAA